MSLNERVSANALPVAFQAAVLTRDLALAMRAYARLDASAVMVNDHTAFRVDWMPFAGLKESGLGVGGDPVHLPGDAGRQDVRWKAALITKAAMASGIVTRMQPILSISNLSKTYASGFRL